MRTGSAATRPADDRVFADWRRDDGWIALAATLLIFGGFALYGAMKPQTALVFTLLWSLLAGACLVRPSVRDASLRPKGLAIIAGLFALVILIALWSLTPFAPGGPHPTWAYLGIRPGATTINKSSTLTEILKLLGLACVFLVGLASGASDKRARLALHAILTLGTLYGVWAFFAFVLNRGPGHSRLEGSFLSANTAGTVFATLLVLAFGPLIRHLRTDQRQRLTKAAPFGLAALVFFGCLLATASRGGFVAAVAGLIAVGLLQVFAGRTRWTRALAVTATIAVALLALVASAGDYLITRLLGASQDVAERAAITRLHWAAFKDSPLLGYGLGSFDDLNRTLLSAGNFSSVWNVRATHNVYLSWLEQAGLLGAIPMFACIAAVILITLRRSLQRSRTTNLLFALLAANLVVMAHGFTDFALEMFAVAAFWSYLLGLQLRLAHGSAR